MSDMNQSVSRDSSGQSADLRTRIATLLELLRPVTPMEAADAVIRELDSHGWLIDPESGERRRNYPREGNGTSARKDTDE